VEAVKEEWRRHDNGFASGIVTPPPFLFMPCTISIQMLTINQKFPKDITEGSCREWIFPE
jgi:hypothetical protein